MSLYWKCLRQIKKREYTECCTPARIYTLGAHNITIGLFTRSNIWPNEFLIKTNHYIEQENGTAPTDSPFSNRPPHFVLLLKLYTIHLLLKYETS